MSLFAVLLYILHSQGQFRFGVIQTQNYSRKCLTTSNPTLFCNDLTVGLCGFDRDNPFELILQLVAAIRSL